MTSRLRRCRLSSVSRKRAGEQRIYRQLVRKLLKDHPICQLWLAEHSWKAVGMCCYARPGTTAFVTAEELLARGAWRSECCHHKRGRGRYFLDESTFAALSNAAHARVHAEPAWAEANGWLDPRRNSRSSFLTP